MAWILNEMETMRKCSQGASLTRYNDGELGYAFRGWSHRLQPIDGKLVERLREVFHADVPGLLVGVPRVLPPDDDSLPVSTKGCQRFWNGSWQNFVRKQLHEDRQYASGFASYPDRHVPREQWPEFIELCDATWAGGDVVLVGSRADCIEGTRGIDAIKGTATLEFVEIPPKRFWAAYDDTLQRLLDFPRHSLMLVAAGVPGTVLAHDLHVEGFQAVDIGRLPLRLRLHMGIEQ